MTALMCQVTCALCNIKIDETKWHEHLISTKHLQNCKNVDSIIAINFFKMIFEAKPEKKKIFNLKNERTHDFWRLYFSTKLAKEKFDTLCNNSIDKTEIEKNLETDFNDFVSKVTPVIGKNYFGSMKDLTFCKICSIEINKSLLYEHINSKEHKDIENYLIVKCMTYCEVCKKEIKNDEWREHIISEKHLELEEKNYCGLCKMKYDRVYNNKRDSSDSGLYHLSRELHKQNEKRLEFHAN